MIIRRKIHDLWYWLKCKLFHPYNVVKIKSLPYTWTDRDHIMVHAMFTILDDFIKKEKPDLIIDWDSDPEHRKARDKMDELNDWFHNIYLKYDPWEGIELDYTKNWDEMFIKDPNRPGIYEMKPFSDSDQAKMNIIHARDRAMEEELEKKLREILDIRKYMWT